MYLGIAVVYKGNTTVVILQQSALVSATDAASAAERRGRPLIALPLAPGRLSVCWRAVMSAAGSLHDGRSRPARVVCAPFLMAGQI